MEAIVKKKQQQGGDFLGGLSWFKFSLFHEFSPGSPPGLHPGHKDMHTRPNDDSESAVGVPVGIMFGSYVALW